MHALKEIRKQAKKIRACSVPYLQRKYRLTEKDAMKVLEQIKRGCIQIDYTDEGKIWRVFF